MSEYTDPSDSIILSRPDEEAIKKARKENELGVIGVGKVIKALSNSLPLDKDFQSVIDEHFQGWTIDDFKKLFDLYKEQPNQKILSEVSRTLGLPLGSSTEEIIEAIRNLDVKHEPTPNDINKK